MGRHARDLGARKSVRIAIQSQGFLIPAPDAPWIECTIVDVSDGGVCLSVGELVVPKLFGLAFTASGEVLRVGRLGWRRGEGLGARGVTAKELRAGRSDGREAEGAWGGFASARLPGA